MKKTVCPKIYLFTCFSNYFCTLHCCKNNLYERRYVNLNTRNLTIMIIPDNVKKMQIKTMHCFYGSVYKSTIPYYSIKISHCPKRLTHHIQTLIKKILSLMHGFMSLIDPVSEVMKHKKHWGYTVLRLSVRP